MGLVFCHVRASECCNARVFQAGVSDFSKELLVLRVGTGPAAFNKVHP